MARLGPRALDLELGAFKAERIRPGCRGLARNRLANLATRSPPATNGSPGDVRLRWREIAGGEQDHLG